MTSAKVRNDDYRAKLKADVLLREFLVKKLRGQMVADIEMERSQGIWKIRIFTSRPGNILGKSGEGVQTLKIEVDKFYRALDGSWVHGKTKEKIIPAMTIGGQLQGISKIQGWRFGLPKETKEGQSWYGLDLGYTPKPNEPFKYDKSSWSIVNTTSNAKFYNQVPLLYTESPQGNITEAERAGSDWTNRGKNLGVDSPAYVAPMVPKEDAEDNESDSEDHSQQLPRQQPQPRRYNAPRSPPPNYCPPGR
jgi:hypothetical protein